MLELPIVIKHSKHSRLNEVLPKKQYNPVKILHYKKESQSSAVLNKVDSTVKQKLQKL